MKKLIISAVLALFCTAAGAQTETYVKVGDKVPSFKVAMTDGRTIDIADLKGKVVLVNFWATWCGPCRSELKRVQKEVIDRFAGRDFVFLPISREEDKATVEKFLEEEGYTWVSGLDPERKIYSLFAEGGIPRNFLIGTDGRIVLCETGYTAEKFDEMLEIIEKTLEKK